MKHSILQKKQGFTLIELVLYMGLFILLIVVITDILVATLDVQFSSSSSASITQDGRYIYTRFIYDVNRASNVTVPLNLGDSSNTLQLSISGTTYTYSVSNGNLIITDPSGSYPMNSYDTSVSNLSFKRLGNTSGKHTFSITYTLQSRTLVKGKTESRNFQTTAGLR